MTSGDRPEGDDGGETSESTSAGSFLRQVAFAPHVQPPRPERDRTGQTLGRFQIKGLLGRGGMGVVYEALDLTLRRKVALKLLRAGAIEGPEHRRRFLREARAAAAVNHPNIVTVFEAGEVDGDVFIAMELVDGADARAWRAARPRTRREILAVYAMAGRGLAAAHRAGLVHRDFKPDNVLVDASGRARVADFGLAAGVAYGTESLGRSDRSLPGGRLTQAGRVMGTPGYIAPECLAGRDADARADQFAFCVALFEALEGHRPYDETSLRAGGLPNARSLRPRKTPLWLRGVLARGLALGPASRFASMDALLARMERARVWPRRAAAALVVGAAALALWAGAPRQQAPSCDAVAAEVPAAWLSARGAIHEAFARAAVPYAADASDRVRVSLDAWTDRWSQARLAGCRWPRSAATECLARQQGHFGAVLDLLRRADAQVVAQAVTVVNGLDDPAHCVQGLAAQAPVATPAFDDASGVSRRIAEARALLAAGKYAESAALGESLRRDAQGVPAVEADAFAVAAMASWKAGAPDAVRALVQARWAAERARRDALSAELALALSEAYRQRGDRERSEEWLGHAEATLARVGKELRLESMVLAARAQLEGLHDRRAPAHALALRSLALREQALGNGHLEVAESLMLAAAFAPFDQLAEGAALARRALDIRVATLGSDHPDVAAAWERLAQLHGDQYDHRRQREAQEHALRIRMAALGPDHPDIARSHWGLGNAHASLGHDAAARDHFLIARELLDGNRGPGSVRAGVAELVIAELEAGLGDVEKALARARAAIAQIERTLGPDSASTILELCVLADLLVQHGELDEAESLYTRALRNGERRDPENAKVALPLEGLSKLARIRGQLGVARDAAERALRVGSTLYPGDHPVHLPVYQVLFHAALATGELKQAKHQAARIQAVADAWLVADDPLRVEVQQVQALMANANGERARAVTLARAALDEQQARPWQVLRLAEARAVLACVLGARDAEAARLLRDAVKALRAAKAFGRADATLARCR
jgi:tetratricopeptide (TPR) repeat protein